MRKNKGSSMLKMVIDDGSIDECPRSLGSMNDVSDPRSSHHVAIASFTVRRFVG